LLEQLLQDEEPVFAEAPAPEVNPNIDINLATFEEWHPGQ
jgi:hypothetical protein